MLMSAQLSLTLTVKKKILEVIEFNILFWFGKEPRLTSRITQTQHKKEMRKWYYIMLILCYLYYYIMQAVVQLKVVEFCKVKCGLMLKTFLSCLPR